MFAVLDVYLLLTAHTNSCQLAELIKQPAVCLGVNKWQGLYTDTCNLVCIHQLVNPDCTPTGSSANTEEPCEHKAS